MKTFNKTLIAATTIATFGLAAAPAALAVDASASLATSYLFRGAEENTGSAVINADISSSTAGVSYGLFISSGDTSTEHDYYASYAGTVSGISYELGYADYNYQKQDEANGTVDFEETFVSLSYGDVSLSHYNNQDSEDDYTVASYGMGALTVSYGEMDNVRSHVDLSYAVNDSLSVTVSKPDNDDATKSNDAIFVASYSLPF